MIVKGIARKYIGAISSEHRAAKLYDKYAIIIQGLSVNIIFAFLLYTGKNKFPIHEGLIVGASR